METAARPTTARMTRVLDFASRFSNLCIAVFLSELGRKAALRLVARPVWCVFDHVVLPPSLKAKSLVREKSAHLQGGRRQ